MRPTILALLTTLVCSAFIGSPSPDGEALGCRDELAATHLSASRETTHATARCLGGSGGDFVALNRFVISQDGRYLLIKHPDHQAAFLFERSSGEQIARLAFERELPRGYVLNYISISPNGRYALIAAGTSYWSPSLILRLYDIEGRTNSDSLIFNHPIGSPVFRDDESVLIFSGSEGPPFLRDPAEGIPPRHERSSFLTAQLIEYQLAEQRFIYPEIRPGAEIRPSVFYMPRSIAAFTDGSIEMNVYRALGPCLDTTFDDYAGGLDGELAATVRLLRTRAQASECVLTGEVLNRAAQRESLTAAGEITRARGQYYLEGLPISAIIQHREWVRELRSEYPTIGAAPGHAVPAFAQHQYVQHAFSTANESAFFVCDYNDEQCDIELYEINIRNNQKYEGAHHD